MNHRGTEDTEFQSFFTGREAAGKKTRLRIAYRISSPWMEDLVDCDQAATQVPSELNELTGLVIGAAMEVHKTLGPGLLETAYAACLSRELDLRGISYEKEKPLPVTYKGTDLDCGYRLDFVIGNQLILELKTCESIQPIHEAQLLTYLKLTGIRTGLLINFNVPILKRGLKRLSL
jgi:GxxExxY protein